MSSLSLDPCIYQAYQKLSYIYSNKYIILAWKETIAWFIMIEEIWITRWNSLLSLRFIVDKQFSNFLPQLFCISKYTHPHPWTFLFHLQLRKKFKLIIWWDIQKEIYHHTRLVRVWDSICLKTCRQNAEIKLSKVQTHNFDVSFLKTCKTGDGTKEFYGDDIFWHPLLYQYT